MGFAVAALLGALLWAPAAFAGTATNQRPLLFSFNGGDSSLGPFTAPLAIASDDETGSVYAINGAGSGQGPGSSDAKRVVCKFDKEGKAQDFTAGSSAGKSCLDGTDTEGKAFGVKGFFGEGAIHADVAVDNSGGLGGAGEGEQGRIYLSEEKGPVHAFTPQGAHINWILPRETVEPCGIAVDAAGRLWVGDLVSHKVIEFAPASAGGPPIEIESFHLKNPEEIPCRLGVDSSGKNIYVGVSPTGLDKYHEGIYDSTLSSEEIRDLTVDQFAPGHIFATSNRVIRDYEPCATPGCPGTDATASPFGGDLIGDVSGIARNQVKDWVYVSDPASKSIKVFGPSTSGTVPDVSCQEADGITRSEAIAHCTINPLGLSNAYHFEYKPCASVECIGAADANWGSASSSAEQSIEPTDSVGHPVSAALAGLNQNSWYEVRLVGTNAEVSKNHLSAYSAPAVFQTLPPPKAEIECSISAITTESAHVDCTVDPKEDATNWKIQMAALFHASQANCKALAAGAFKTIKEGSIPTETVGTVPISADLVGLDPSQSYCVRATATNSGGVGSEDLTFSTPAIPPSEASAAFAAPRTDTSARINAWVNPNGEADFSYRFEWSADGSNWNKAPLRESTIDAREQILVAEELSGLDPATTYHYRLAAVENEAGPVSSMGGEKTFTTRTTAEIEETQPPTCPNEDVRAVQHAGYLGSCRGIELVNEPDKGNQNSLHEGPWAQRTSPMSASGEEVFWEVAAGAPGSPNGSLGAFLAKRTLVTPWGWSSTSPAPPAAQQLGGGDLTYHLLATTPDLGTYVFNAAQLVGVSVPEPPALVRVRRGQPEEVLKEYKKRPANPGYEQQLELSDDGAHVFFPDNQSGELEDIGSPGKAPPVLSIMPEGLQSECGVDPAGFAQNEQKQGGYDWIATDASRVYFQVAANGHCNGPRGLYVRDPKAAVAKTIDQPESGRSPELIRATPNGRVAYFITASKLDPSDEDSGGDVYRWDEQTGKSSCLTCAAPSGASANLPTGSGPWWLGALVSDDFSHIYFQSHEQLVAGKGKQGELNLYVWSGGQIGFVATVGADVLSRSTDARLSEDGEVLSFRAVANPALSADRTADQCVSSFNRSAFEQCHEDYLYDDGDGSIECISCRHDGVTDHSAGSATLSGDGRTVAFDSGQALVGSDVNSGADLYEWRAGVRHLISNGVSNYPGDFAAPAVAGVDRDGSDILFTLVPPEGRLTGFERDGVLNLYDARIGGGFEPPNPPAHCIEDSCQGPLQPPPTVAQVGSSALRGSGPVKPKKPCAKKQSKSSGRAAKASKRGCRKPQRHHRKASHKRKGAR